MKTIGSYRLDQIRELTADDEQLLLTTSAQRASTVSDSPEHTLPETLSRAELLEAFGLFDRAHPHPFAPSTDYDVLHAGKRYPPKAIVGIALSEKAGRLFGPSDFRGGQGTWCFRVLTSAGFPIVPKGELPLFPDEVPNGGYIEGAVSSVVVNRYERDRDAREACIRHYGAARQGCGIEFGNVYGELGLGFIHVHHVVPLASIRAVYTVDPIRDLRPVCPNCHAMIHRNRDIPLSIEELRMLVDESRRTQ